MADDEIMISRGDYEQLITAYNMANELHSDSSTSADFEKLVKKKYGNKIQTSEEKLEPYVAPLKKELEESGTGKMKAFGNSMLPIIKSGSLLTFIKKEEYDINDIVFCKVKGRYIDAHKVTKKDMQKGYMIKQHKHLELIVSI